MVLWDHGALGPWAYVTMGFWYLGALGTWGFGSMGLWDHGALGPFVIILIRYQLKSSSLIQENMEHSFASLLLFNYV